MRPFLIAILNLFILSCSAQTAHVKIFRTTEYINGNVYRKVSDTVKLTNEQLDIYFFKRHFFSPYYLPEKFIDQQYKNEKVSVWRDPNGKKDYQRNWENTYTYDSVGRVKNYSYSGCFICSNLPYSYSVAYNPSGHVERIFNTMNMKEGFMFFYNSKGDIVKMEKYLLDKLETVIELAD